MAGSENQEVRACMKCGSSDLNSNPGGAYAAQTAYGMGGAMTGQALCNKCGHYGLPIIVDSEEARAAYEKSKKK